MCIDIKLAATARLADYVLAPKLCLEREDVTLLTDIWHHQAYSQYTPPWWKPRATRSREWEFFWGVGKRMGLAMSRTTAPSPWTTSRRNSTCSTTSPPVQGCRWGRSASVGGTVYPGLDVIIEAADPATQGHLDLFPAGLEAELEAAYRDAQVTNTGTYSHLLVSRRMKNTYNSTGPELSLLQSKGTTNPAFMHSQDLAALGITSGEIIEVYSAHGRIPRWPRPVTISSPA